MNSMRQMINLMEGVMAVPGMGKIGGSESDMQTAGTVGRNASYAEFDATQGQATEESFSGEDTAEVYKQHLDALNARLLPMRKAGQQLAADAIYAPAYGSLNAAFPKGQRAYVKAQNDRMWAGNNWQRDDKSGRSAVDEEAPPGMEDVVMKLKKEYPDDHSKAFATAWSIYNKKHGKAEEGCSMEESVPAVDSCQQTNPAAANVACAMEESVSDLIYDQQYSRFSDLMNSFVEPQEAFDVLSREMAEQGIEGEEHDAIMQRLESDFFPDDSAFDMMNGPDDFSDDAEALASAGHGSDEDYGGDDFPIDEARLNENNDILSQHPAGVEQWKRNRTFDLALYNDLYEYYADDIPPRVRNDDARLDKWMMQLFDKLINVSMEEAFDMQNGYNDVNNANGNDFFPNGADSPVIRAVGPSGARQGDNPEQKRMQVAEVHKELVYGYRSFLKESAQATQKKS